MTFEDHAQRAMEAMRVLDKAFREATEAAVQELDDKGLREFRQLRRKWARFHADAAEFAEEQAPTMMARSGGT